MTDNACCAPQALGRNKVFCHIFCAFACNWTRYRTSGKIFSSITYALQGNSMPTSKFSRFCVISIDNVLALFSTLYLHILLHTQCIPILFRPYACDVKKILSMFKHDIHFLTMSRLHFDPMPQYLTILSKFQIHFDPIFIPYIQA